MNDARSTKDESPVPRLAKRPVDAIKEISAGALLIGGSRGMAGAAGLAGMATLRSGAGLVRLGGRRIAVSIRLPVMSRR